jgi:hypothetical protein
VTFRPSQIRVWGFVVFGMLGVIPIVVDDVSIFGRVAGCIVVSMVPLVLVVSKRTWVTVTESGIEVGSIRGTKRFATGQASVRRFAVPGGVVRDGTAIHLEGRDDSSCTISLGFFSCRDRHNLLRQLHLALGDESGVSDH